MKGQKLLRTCLCALFAALLCVVAPIALPIGPIPISFSFLVIALIARLLGPLCGGASVLLYLSLGAIGLPVFGGGMGGFGALLGPTGGYLWSYLPTCLLMGWLYAWIDRRSISYAKRMLAEMLAGLCGLSVCYLFGTLQYAAIANISFFAALAVCVLPFLAFDIGKLLLLFFLSDRLLKIKRIRLALGLGEK